jgi:hypothetical protein
LSCLHHTACHPRAAGVQQTNLISVYLRGHISSDSPTCLPLAKNTRPWLIINPALSEVNSSLTNLNHGRGGVIFNVPILPTNSRCATHQRLIPFSSSFQVLLPPKTALLYSQLLQLEVSQLAMGRNADWDRILHIRHLKDRMIRKCQRLSRTAHTPGTTPAAFRIVHAPPDFRLKEMERWLRDQVSRRKGTKEVRRQPSAETANTQSQSSQRAYTQTQPTSRAPQTPRVSTSATPVQRISSTRLPAGVRRQGSGSSRSSNYGDSRASTESPRQRPTAYTQNLPPRSPYLSPVEERSETPQPSTPLTYVDTPQIAVEEATSSSPPTGREDAVSPVPLPHLYRPPSMLAPMAEMAAAMLSEPVPVPLVQEMPEPLVESFLPSELPVGMPQPSVPIDPAFDPDQSVAGPSRPLLVRRRSSLRQGGGRSSANGTPKVVSWAMDRDWADYMTKFDHVVYAAEFAGSSHFLPSLLSTCCRILICRPSRLRR